MGWRLQPQSIHGELAQFVVVLALPLLGLIGYNAYERAQHALADAEADVRRLTEIAADRAARFVEDARLTLEAMARRPLVRAMDPARCDPGLKDLLELYPRAVNFLVVDPGGRIICGSIPPPRDRVVRIRDEALLREVLASGRFALSQPVMGRINRRWTVAAVQPVPGADGEVAGSVSMSIDLVNWRPVPDGAGIAGGALVALLSGGVVIAASQEPAAWVGRDIGSSEILQRVRAMKEGTVRARGAAGVDRIWAFRPVAGTNWTALAGISSDLVLAPVREGALQVSALIAVVVGAVLALAVLFGRRLTRPMRDIAEALRLRAEGRRDVPIPVSGPREVAAMAQELNRGIERGERLAQEREELLERMPIACLLYDRELRVSYANAAAERTFGWSRGEMAGRTAAELYVPAERRAIVEEVFARLRAGEYVSASGEARRKDGTRVILDWVNTPLVDRDGGFLGLMCMAQDITERLRAEKRLELTQRLFAALSEVNEAIVRARDREELFRQCCRICVERIGFVVAFVSLVDAGRGHAVPQVYAGPGSRFIGEAAFPLDPAQPLGTGVTATAVRTRRAAVANDIDADPARQAGRPLRERIGSKSAASFPLFQGDDVIGALTLYSATPDFFDADLVELLRRMADDLSFALDKLAEHDNLDELRRSLDERVQRRTAELVAARLELREFIDSMSTMNAKIAPDGRLLMANRMALAASGLTERELLATNFLEGKWWSFDAAVQARVRAAFARACTGETVNYEERIQVFGTVIDISFSLVPVRGADGAVDYVVAEGRDISQMKKTEAQLRLRTAELEGANQELEAFSYSVSHDLRAPVRHVDGFVRLLHKELAKPSEKAAHYLQTIAAAARRMGNLIDDLLKLSRTARQPLALRRVELGPLLRELQREAALEAGKRKLEWSVGELPAVMADPALLRIVLHNLLSNALKYTRSRPVARIAIEARPLGPGEVALSVRDNGVGFDMRFSDKLFGVFQRLHREEEFEGTGIGLATARRIMHRHGRRIWGEGEPDKGATFTFTLTQAEAEHEGSADIAGRG